MKDVIITGGSGFIGTAMCRHLNDIVAPGCEVVGLSSKEVDLVDREATFQWFERYRRSHDVTHIFHLAAVYKAGGWPATHPATQFHLNMAININVLEAWKRFSPEARLVNVISYCMYPDHERPHPETEMYWTEPEEYLYAYAFTKKALVIGQRAYCQEFGLSGISAVLPTVYGPGDSFSEDSHVMGALIGKFSRAAREGLDSVEVWGDGNQEREFLYIEDAVDGIFSVACKGKSPVLNIGVGRGASVKAIAETISCEVRFEGEIRYNTDRFVGAQRRVLCTDLVRRETRWEPKVSLKEGIQRTITAYIDQSNPETDA